MGSTYTPQGITTRLTPADEAASIQSSGENLGKQAFLEWPNEAGVSTLFPSAVGAIIRPADQMSSLMV
jgi:hypothetical protein